MREILLSVDPGETNGVCGWYLDTPVPEVVPELFTHVTIPNIYSFLNDVESKYKVKVLVIEKFEVFRNKATKLIGSDMKTPQMIGVCKTYGHRWGAEIVERRPMSLSIALKKAGLSMPSDHSQSHRICAMAHGNDVLMDKGLIKSKLGMEVEGGTRKGIAQLKRELG